MPEVFGRRVPGWVIPAGAGVLALIVILVLVFTVFTGGDEEKKLTSAAPTRAPEVTATAEPEATAKAGAPKATKAPTPAPSQAPNVAPAGPEPTPLVPTPEPLPTDAPPTPAPEETPIPSAEFFHHTATAQNSDCVSSYINSEQTNNDPNALVFVTHNWNPLGGEGVYNDNSLGVHYAAGQWAVFNTTFTDCSDVVPQGSIYNVTVKEAGDDAFVHTATGANTGVSLTYIDNPATNGNPNAILIVTPNWNPGGDCGCISNPREVGVYYDGAKWTIFNEDLTQMPVGAKFNVLVVDPGPKAFVHEATNSNITDNYTALDNAATNEQPSVGVFVTQQWGAGGGSGAYNAKSVGAFRFSDPLRWAVFNEDTASDLPAGADFNVLVLLG